MQRKWKPGDQVTVTTVNKGLPFVPPRKGSKRKDVAESWDGEIAGPSLVGPGWWMVRRLIPTLVELDSCWGIPQAGET